MDSFVSQQPGQSNKTNPVSLDKSRGRASTQVHKKPFKISNELIAEEDDDLLDNEGFGSSGKKKGEAAKEEEKDDESGSNYDDDEFD